jgi:hypothetical protein
MLKSHAKNANNNNLTDGDASTLRGWLYEQIWRAKSYQAKPSVAEVLRVLEISQYWAPQQLQELRDGKLRQLVKHAYEQIPLYRQLLDERGVTPRSVEGLRDLQ